MAMVMLPTPLSAINIEDPEKPFPVMLMGVSINEDSSDSADDTVLICYEVAPDRGALAVIRMQNVRVVEWQFIDRLQYGS